MIQRTIGEDIGFTNKIQDDIAPIYIDCHQLENVLLNLSLNARDAMPDSGQPGMIQSNIVLPVDCLWFMKHGAMRPQTWGRVRKE